MTSFDYSGKVVAITGASSGIGREIAMAFYECGAKLALCSRSAERVKEAISDFAKPDDPRILIVTADTGNVPEIHAFRDATVKHFGRRHWSPCR